MIPVEGHKGLFRDENSNAILNCNDYEYNQYLKEKENRLNEKQEINSLKEEVKELKSILLKFINDNTQT